MKKLLDKIKSIEHGFKHIVEVGNIILADKTKNHLEFAKIFISDESYQVRMLGVYILGERSLIDKAALEILETEIPGDTNWRVQEMLAKAFDRYCQKIGYEKALPTIKRWIDCKHENINRAIIEGLRIWTGKSYFKENPKLAIDLISKHKSNKSEYVRKSVGNALRDIKRKFPTEVETEIKTWDFTDEKIEYTYKLIEK